MKINAATATLLLAAVGSVTAAPTSFDESSSGLSRRDVDVVNNAIANLDEFTRKRLTFSEEELTKREVQIVTDVLTAIKNTQLAPGIILYFINDPVLGPIASNVIVGAVKSGIVSIATLLKSLNDSGLAVSVIKNLISNCQFYAQIYKIALKFISNLANQILGQQKRGYIEEDSVVYEPSLVTRETVYLETRDSGAIITSLMESLKNSGLANQVVNALVTNDGFYTWGADLITKLINAKVITLGQLIDALIASNLVPSLIENFLNFDTFKTVIVNALAAAFGKCDGATLTSVKPSTTKTPVTSGIPSSLPPVNCKKRRRSYNY